jgi:hypothetical protein
VPTRLSERQRELLEELAAASGEISSDGETTLADGPRTRRGKRSLGDRIKDAIS